MVILPDLKVRRVWLFLTERCNSKCIYCSDLDHFYCPKDSSKEVIDATMRFLECNRQKPEIEFWGGEPFLRNDLIRYAVDKYPSNYYIVGTNGVLLQSNVLKRGINQVIVSIDGDKKDQDRQRPLVNGQGSFDVLNWDVLVECTSCLHIVKYPGGGSLVKNLQFFIKKGFKSFQIEYAYGSNPTDQDLKEYYREIEEIADRYFGYIANWASYGKNTQSDENLFMLGGEITLAVSVEGILYLTSKHTDEDSYRLGNVFDGYDVRAVEDIIHRFKTSPYCSKCRCRRNCCARGTMTGHEHELDRYWFENCDRIKGEYDIVSKARERHDSLKELTQLVKAAK
jgi:uncharacterized protein